MSSFTLDNDSTTRPPLSINSNLASPKQKDLLEPIPVTRNEGDVQTDLEEVIPVTPNEGDVQTNVYESVWEELGVALDKSITWQQKKSKDETELPHPLKLHVLSAYKEDLTLKSLLCRKYENLNKVLRERKLKDYPLCVRLFLLSLCSMLFGLPKRYRNKNPWVVIANAWSDDITAKEMEEVCKSAIRDFVSLDSEGRCDEAEGRISDCVQSWVDCLHWPHRKKTDVPVFCSGLNDRHRKIHLLANLSRNLAENWKDNIDAKMFLFAIMALIADGTKDRSSIGIVQKSVIGCRSRTPFKNYLQAAKLIVGMSTELENSSIPPIAIQNTVIAPSIPDVDINTHVIGPWQSETDVTSTVTPAVIDDEEEPDFDPAALELLHEQVNLDKKSRNPAVQQLLVNVAHKILQEEKSNHVSTLNILTANSRLVEVDYFHAPRLQKGKLFSELKQAKKLERGNLVNALIDHQAGRDPTEILNLT